MKSIPAFVERRLLALMIVCYAMAGLVPGPSVTMRAAGPLLLAVMMFNAGLGSRAADLAAQVRRPWRLLLGVAANALLPALVLPLVAIAVCGWLDGHERSGLLIGLALVLSMPIAGSAAAWGHNAGGNLALAVGMVLGSALLSPLTIPLGLHVAGQVAPELDALDQMSTGCSVFALAVVVLPCLGGLATRHILGERRATAIMPWAKTITLVDILLLSYATAATALAKAVAHPDLDLLALVIAVATAVCTGSFLLGRWLSRQTRSDRRDTIALTFATGMNNTSAAAVLATAWFTHRPAALLFILAYSLLQRTTAATLRFRV